MQLPRADDRFLRHKELCGDSIAKALVVPVAFDSPIERVKIADTRFTDPQVRQLMDESKGLRRSGVVIVEYDERHEWVCKSEAPKFSRVDVRVMASQISLCENKDTFRLRAIPQTPEQCIIAIESFSTAKRQIKHLLNVICDLLDVPASAKTPNERQRLQFLVLILPQKLQNLLLTGFYFGY
jgi:hypothetical protein